MAFRRAHHAHPLAAFSSALLVLAVAGAELIARRLDADDLVETRGI